MLVTLSDFTPQAIADARDLKLPLVDGPDLYARVEKVRTPEPCSKCGEPMLLDRSPHGWWFRCIADGCGGKRNLAREPGQALDLLTRPPD
jgi:hypothetical protein